MTSRKNGAGFAAWATSGAIGAIVIAILSYQYAEWRDRPNLVLSVISKTPVLNPHAPFGDLAITYRGLNLRDHGANVFVVVLRIENRGVGHIRPTDFVEIRHDFFDVERPWGINLEGALLVEPPRVRAASSDYLVENFQILPISSVGTTFEQLPTILGGLNHESKAVLVDKAVTSIPFSRVALDSDSWIELELVAVSKREAPVNLEAVGKITGVSDFGMIEERSGKPVMATEPLEVSPYSFLLVFVFIAFAWAIAR